MSCKYEYLRPRVWVKALEWLLPVERINFDCETVEVDLTSGNGDTAEYDFSEVELMRCTGLKDKNGKLIFEGDILKTHMWREAVVEWDEDNARFLGFLVKGEKRIVYVGREPKVEVIGNIYDNPELLKAK